MNTMYQSLHEQVSSPGPGGSAIVYIPWASCMHARAASENATASMPRDMLSCLVLSTDAAEGLRQTCEATDFSSDDVSPATSNAGSIGENLYY